MQMNMKTKKGKENLLCLLLFIFIGSYQIGIMSAGEFEISHKSEMQKIIERAEKNWPDSYDMQRCIIEAEVKRLKKVEQFKKESLEKID